MKKYFYLPTKITVNELAKYASYTTIRRRVMLEFDKVPVMAKALCGEVVYGVVKVGLQKGAANVRI